MLAPVPVGEQFLWPGEAETGVGYLYEFRVGFVRGFGVLEHQADVRVLPDIHTRRKRRLEVELRPAKLRVAVITVSRDQITSNSALAEP